MLSMTDYQMTDFILQFFFKKSVKVNCDWQQKKNQAEVLGGEIGGDVGWGLLSGGGGGSGGSSFVVLLVSLSDVESVVEVSDEDKSNDPTIFWLSLTTRVQARRRIQPNKWK